MKRQSGNAIIYKNSYIPQQIFVADVLVSLKAARGSENGFIQELLPAEAHKHIPSHHQQQSSHKQAVSKQTRDKTQNFTTAIAYMESTDNCCFNNSAKRWCKYNKQDRPKMMNVMCNKARWHIHPPEQENFTYDTAPQQRFIISPQAPQPTRLWSGFHLAGGKTARKSWPRNRMSLMLPVPYGPLGLPTFHQ